MFVFREGIFGALIDTGFGVGARLAGFGVGIFPIALKGFVFFAGVLALGLRLPGGLGFGRALRAQSLAVSSGIRVKRSPTSP